MSALCNNQRKSSVFSNTGRSVNVNNLFQGHSVLLSNLVCLVRINVTVCKVLVV